MERETGIEPATNSLEGCDSTTELLPPTSLDSPASERSLGTSAGRPRYLSANSIASNNPSGLPPVACQAARRNSRAPPTKRRVVAREGLEPSKAQGRQIYSLLRLTASLPRRCVVWLKTLETLALALAPSSEAHQASEGGKSWRRDLNPRPADYKSAALPD